MKRIGLNLTDFLRVLNGPNHGPTQEMLTM